LQHPQHEIDLDAALVELVQQNTGHVLQQWIRRKSAQQYAGGHRDQPSPGADASIKTDVIADILSDLRTELCRQPMRCGAGRHPSRLDQQDAAFISDPRVQQRRGHARRLPRAGRSPQYHRDGLTNLIDQFV
jgi:hypothetical protein